MRTLGSQYILSVTVAAVPDSVQSTDPNIITKVGRV